MWHALAIYPSMLPLSPCYELLWPFLTHPGLPWSGIPIQSLGKAADSLECIHSSQAGAHMHHTLSRFLLQWTIYSGRNHDASFAWGTGSLSAITWTPVIRLIWLLLALPSGPGQHSSHASLLGVSHSHIIPIPLTWHKSPGCHHAPSSCGGSVHSVLFLWQFFSLSDHLLLHYRDPLHLHAQLPPGFTLHFVGVQQTVQHSLPVAFPVPLCWITLWDLTICDLAPRNVFLLMPCLLCKALLNSMHLARLQTSVHLLLTHFHSDN